MSPDDIDHLIVSVVEFVEQEDLPHDWPDDNALFQQFKDLVYEILEPLCTRDRNYN